MTVTEQWIFEERTQQLAIVHLTRRDDLVVTAAAEGYGIDLLVTICQDGVRTGRLFGVQLQGYASLTVTANGSLDTYTLNTPPVKTATPTELPFPLCLFLFAMNNDVGYYRWLLEPVLVVGQSPKLLREPQPHFKRLTRSSLDQIVQQVNIWYDAQHRT